MASRVEDGRREGLRPVRREREREREREGARSACATPATRARERAHLQQGTTGANDGDDASLDGHGDSLGDIERLFLVDLLHVEVCEAAEEGQHSSLLVDWSVWVQRFVVQSSNMAASPSVPSSPNCPSPLACFTCALLLALVPPPALDSRGRRRVAGFASRRVGGGGGLASVGFFGERVDRAESRAGPTGWIAYFGGGWRREGTRTKSTRKSKAPTSAAILLLIELLLLLMLSVLLPPSL